MMSISANKKWWFIAAMAFLCLLAATGGMAALMQNREVASEASLPGSEDLGTFPGPSDPASTQFIQVEHAPQQLVQESVGRVPAQLNILLLGFDLSRQRFGGRTDAILIVRLKTAQRRMGVISVPRDLWVGIPGAEPGRINSVYRTGERLNGRGGGLLLLKEVIRNTFDIEIDHTVSVDFSGFSALIDSLGGIDVNVHCPIRDNFHVSGQPGKTEHFSLDAGMQHIDGRQALFYTRSRHGRSDLDRSSRQQAVLSGILEKIADPQNWHRLPSVAARVHELVSTDMPLRRMLSLAARYRTIDSSKRHGMVIREPLVQEHRTEDGQAVLLLDREMFAERLQRLFKTKALPGAPLRKNCADIDAALNWKSKTTRNNVD